MRQPRGHEGIQEAITALLKHPESTLEGWKNALNNSKWKLITGLICRSGTYWGTELGYLCITCVIKQKVLKNNPNYKKRSDHELEPKLWLSGHLCNNCYVPTHVVKDAATCPSCIVKYWNTRGAIRRGAGSTLGTTLNQPPPADRIL